MTTTRLLAAAVGRPATTAARGLAAVLLVVGTACSAGTGGTASATPDARAIGTATAASAAFGPVYEIKDHIVNLADAGGRRYLRFTVAIAFEPPATPVPAAQADKAFAARVKPYAPALDDAVTTLLSSKTASDLASVDGKARAKAEILAVVQRALGKQDHVTAVYFPELVVQ